MSNEIVKYNNDLNKISTRQWSAVEMDIFFSIVAKVKNKDLDVVNLDKNDLMKLTNYTGEHGDRFVKSLMSLVDHVSELKYRKYERNGNSNKLLIMNLFDQFEFNWTDDFSEITGKIKISKAFKYILNNFDLSFTTFELDEFTKLRSTYSKTLYRQLKQYRKVGYREFKIDEFRYIMSIPESYKQMDIDRRVINVALKELAPIFKNLKVQKIKLKKKGSPVASFAFKWTPEKTNTWIEGQPQPNPNKPKKQKEQPKALNLDDKYYPQAEEKSDEEIRQEMLELQRKLKEGSL